MRPNSLGIGQSKPMQRQYASSIPVFEQSSEISVQPSSKVTQPKNKGYKSKRFVVQSIMCLFIVKVRKSIKKRKHR